MSTSNLFLSLVKPPVAALTAKVKARRQELIGSFDDRTVREEYGVQHTAWIGPQLRAVREQRGLSQKFVAEQTKTNQSAISRFESVDYGRWSIKKLQQIAKVFGCWVEIRLRSYGDLVDGLPQQNRQGLLVAAFEEDHRLDPSIPPFPDAEKETVRNVQHQIRQWYVAHRKDEDLESKCASQLERWLGGWDLPGVTEDDEPSLFLAEAFSSAGWSGVRFEWFEDAIAFHLGRAIWGPGDRVGFGVLVLAARVPAASRFEPHLLRVWRQIEAGRLVLEPDMERAFVMAVAANQTGAGFLSMWLDSIHKPTQERHSLGISLSLEETLEGMLQIPPVMTDEDTLNCVLWITEQVCGRYFDTPLTDRNVDLKSHYVALLTDFYKQLKSFRQKPLLVAVLVSRLLKTELWNGLTHPSVAAAFLSNIDPGWIREVMIEATRAKDWDRATLSELKRIAVEENQSSTPEMWTQHEEIARSVESRVWLSKQLQILDRAG